MGGMSFLEILENPEKRSIKRKIQQRDLSSEDTKKDLAFSMQTGRICLIRTGRKN